MKKKLNKIINIIANSPADNKGISLGDHILRINGEDIEDIFDYQYLTLDESLDIELERDGSGELYTVHIDKDADEDPGLVFENGLMDDYRRCTNSCVFCFIDQMPPGMRETLYFKDDDSRLSFLQGNYVTLTNMSDHDIDRICKYHLSPINISFQTTNPELRCKMLGNRFAGEALKKVDRLKEAGIIMNGQIVLCKGLNDGEELNRSIRDLTGYMPELQSVSVVPVGLTKFREGLYPLAPFGRDDARQVLDLIHNWQDRIYERSGIHFVHASDEWYMLAGYDLPEEDRYDGYVQIENGVGMVRSLMNEFDEAINNLKMIKKPHEHITIATGKLMYPYMCEMMERLTSRFPRLKIDVYAITNNFFGEMITVSGLITGQDLIAQMKDKDLGDRLLIPENMLRAGEDYFLDDITRIQVSDALQVPIEIVKSSGYDMVQILVSSGVDLHSLLKRGDSSFHSE